GKISGIVVVARLLGVLMPKLDERSLDPRPLGGQELTCTLWIHFGNLTTLTRTARDEGGTRDESRAPRRCARPPRRRHLARAVLDSAGVSRLGGHPHSLDRSALRHPAPALRREPLEDRVGRVRHRPRRRAREYGRGSDPPIVAQRDRRDGDGN